MIASLLCKVILFIFEGNAQRKQSTVKILPAEKCSDCNGDRDSGGCFSAWLGMKKGVVDVKGAGKGCAAEWGQERCEQKMVKRVSAHVKQAEKDGKD